jgi:hypothetical protein
VAAAGDEDTVLVHGDGTQETEPVEIHGKTVTIQAAPGCQPTLRLARDSAARPWQALLASDHALMLKGLRLTRDPGAGAGPALLVSTDGAPLRLSDCKLDVPHGSGPVVCRNPRTLELTRCTLAARDLGVSVEVGNGSACDVRLSQCELRVDGDASAAVSLWAPEVRQSAPVRLALDGNAVAAGRVLAFKALPAPIEVIAEHNDFAFRQSLLSYVSFAGGDSWRRATNWREEGNRYRPAREWLRVNGTAHGVRDQAAWRRMWAGS